MTATLFSPIRIGSLDFPNRIAVAPMCQYSADDGSASDWHLQHWMMLAMTGAGMVTVEMTDVERRGRISHGCLGLYSDAQRGRCPPRARSSPVRSPLPGASSGFSWGHAGRKASCQRPWEGGSAAQVGAGPVADRFGLGHAFADGWHVPHALDAAGIDALVGRVRRLCGARQHA